MVWNFPIRLTLVESLPEGMRFPHDSPHLQSISQTWSNLLSRANSSLDIAAFYLTLRDSDIGLTEPSAIQVEQLLSVICTLYYLQLRRPFAFCDSCT